jgi:hypothetical protein
MQHASTHYHFLVMVADACDSARIANLPVEVKMRDGRILCGVPVPQVASTPAHEVDDTGFKNELILGDVSIALDQVVELRLRHPRA